jgi:hypothetical protein
MTMTSGCGDGPYLVPVSGTVTLDGAPLADAGVMFSPVEPGPSASGTTDAQGKFELMTINDMGAVIGEHQVAVTKRRYVGVKPGEEPAPGGLRVEWLAPRKYANPETSGFTAEVTEDGENHFEFGLTSK